MYNGPERRSDNVHELQEIKVAMATMAAKVEGWMETTTEYRQNLCEKLKDVTEKLNGLPCGERKGWYVSMGKQISFMWAVLAIVLAAIVGSFYAGSNEKAELKKEIKELLCSKSACEK